VLRALLAAAHAEVADLRSENEQQAIAQSEAIAEIERLNSIIAAFMRHRFGPRSEKADDDQFERVMEDLSIAIAKVEAKLDAASSVKGRAEKQRRTNRGQLPAHLERVDQLIDIEAKQCAC
jgi:transposase